MKRNPKNMTSTAIFSSKYKDSNTKHKQFLHYHDAFEICFFLSPVDLSIFIHDSIYKIQDGDIIFMNEFDIHNFIFSDRDYPYHRYLVNFKKEFILPHLKLAGIENILADLSTTKYTHAPTTIRERAELDSLFQSLTSYNACDSEQVADRIQQTYFRSYLTVILMKIWKILGNNQTSSQIGKKDKLVKDVVHFINTNYSLDINLDMLAEHFFVDKFHLSHIFKESTDNSVMAYVQQRRIIEAQRMLIKSKNLKVLDVCFECGFSSPQHFHRVFKATTGTTPLNYKKTNT